MATDECGCCHQQKEIVGVAAVPGIPMSIAWCRDCINADAIPYELCVTNTALIGGRENAAEWWLEGVVTPTLKYFNKTLEQFDADVKNDMDLIERKR